ncbi:MAG: DinB family protein, partial [Gemmatimonadota bacterium]|nr:DinB family protein [Gemmatimonadota bacterium]
ATRNPQPADRSPMPPEPWLRGPVDGVQPALMPAAHALIQAREDIERAASGLAPVQLWTSPGGGAATAGFHLRHIAGSVDRLLTYALGRQLDDRQRAAMAGEQSPGDPSEDAAALVRNAQAAIDRALEIIRATDPAVLFDKREVGRGKLPSTLLGILFHVAEHTQRHVGQLITTAKIVRAGRQS